MCPASLFSQVHVRVSIFMKWICQRTSVMTVLRWLQQEKAMIHFRFKYIHTGCVCLAHLGLMSESSGLNYFHTVLTLPLNFIDPILIVHLEKTFGASVPSASTELHGGWLPHLGVPHTQTLKIATPKKCHFSDHPTRHHRYNRPYAWLKAEQLRTKEWMPRNNLPPIVRKIRRDLFPPLANKWRTLDNDSTRDKKK